MDSDRFDLMAVGVLPFHHYRDDEVTRWGLFVHQDVLYTVYMGVETVIISLPQHYQQTINMHAVSCFGENKEGI